METINWTIYYAKIGTRRGTAVVCRRKIFINRGPSYRDLKKTIQEKAWRPLKMRFHSSILYTDPFHCCSRKLNNAMPYNSPFKIKNTKKEGI